MSKWKIVFGLATCIAGIAGVFAIPQAINAQTTDNPGNLPPNSIILGPIGGHTVSYPKAPKNFNPLTAANEELRKYGFPEKPTNPVDLQHWEAVMKKYKEIVYPTSLTSLGTQSHPPITSIKGEKHYIPDGNPVP